MNRLAILFWACLLAAPACAQSAQGEAPYIDNRSSASDVIRSLYNAVNRGEYLRAWSYFDESDRPDYAKFVEGYSDTATVELAVGKEKAEGAAGTVYWTVPVAIETHRADGETAVFAGCYTLAQPNPVAQEAPPFRPIGIREGELHAAQGPLHDAVPDDCGQD